MTSNIIVLVTMAAACTGGDAIEVAETRIGQNEAICIVWNDTYQVRHDGPYPPAIIWRDDRCGKETWPSAILGGDCADGWYAEESDTILLADHKVISDSSLSHELAHAWLKMFLGDGNLKHDIEWVWGQDGMVWQANTALRNHGL